MSAWKLQIFDLRYRVWEGGRSHLRQWTCDHRYNVWEMTSLRKLWTCVTRYWVWENAHGRDWICDPQIQCLGEVTLGTEDM